MTRTALLGLTAAAAAGAVAVWWWWSPQRPAERLAERAATPEQAALWRAEAGRPAPRDFDRLLTETPRPAGRSGGSPSPTPPPQTTITPGVQNSAHVISSSINDTWSFTGKARVTAVAEAGERITLDAGDGRTIVFVARIGGKPIGLSVGSVVDATFRYRPNPFDYEQVLAVTTGAGTTIVVGVATDQKPAVLAAILPGFRIVARQVEKPINGLMPVSVEVADHSERLMPGAPQPISGVMVQILDSEARPEARGVLEGNPYAIDLLAWRLGREPVR